MRQPTASRPRSLSIRSPRCESAGASALPPHGTNSAGARLCPQDQPQRVQLQLERRNQFPALVEQSDVAAPGDGRAPGGPGSFRRCFYWQRAAAGPSDTTAPGSVRMRPSRAAVRAPSIKIYFEVPVLRCRYRAGFTAPTILSTESAPSRKTLTCSAAARGWAMTSL